MKPLLHQQTYIHQQQLLVVRATKHGNSYKCMQPACCGVQPAGTVSLTTNRHSFNFDCCYSLYAHRVEGTTSRH
jgi:hypothetical protein